jgi:hypothetical protein
MAIRDAVDAIHYYDGGAAADPRWLRAIAWAALPLLAAKVLWLVAAWARFDRSLVPQWMGTVPALAGPKLWHAAAIGTGLGVTAIAWAAAALVAHALGLWWIAQPVDGPGGDRAGGWLRGRLRAYAAVFAPLVVAGVALVVALGGVLSAPAAAAALSVVDAAGSILLWFHLADVAARMRHDRLDTARAAYVVALGTACADVATTLGLLVTLDTRAPAELFVYPSVAAGVAAGLAAFYVLAAWVVAARRAGRRVG